MIALQHPGVWLRAQVLVVTYCALLGVAPLYAQKSTVKYLSSKPFCSFFGEKLPTKIATFSSTPEAEDIIDQIVAVSALARNFTVMAGSVPNAAADIVGGKRIVIYNPNFINDLDDAAGTQWAAIVVMAHEVGHHLNGHTLTGAGSQPRLELEADFFAGFVAAKLGSKRSEAVRLWDVLPSKGSATHPPSSERIVAVGAGWDKACKELGTKCPGKRAPKPVPSQDDDEVADNEEEESPPTKKGGKTKRTDEEIEVPPAVKEARWCATNYGTCPMMVGGVPQGMTCTCYTAHGNALGVAR